MLTFLSDKMVHRRAAFLLSLQEKPRNQFSAKEKPFDPYLSFD
jgi:hypothetical protein